MPIIKNEILLVLFDNGFTSNISYGSQNSYNRIMFSKTGRNFGAGAIVAIILAIIAVIAAMIVAFILLRRKVINKNNNFESAVINLKN